MKIREKMQMWVVEMKEDESDPKVRNTFTLLVYILFSFGSFIEKSW